MHEGHRQRMAERLKKDAKGLQDHELVEILLFYCVPRVNTNPLAHALLSSFGSLGNLLSASYEQLIAIDGVGEKTAEFFAALAELCHRVQMGEVSPPRFYNVRSFSEFLIKRFSGLSDEVVEIYCLDAKGVVRYTEKFTTNEAHRVTVEARPLFELLAAQKPHAVVLAHNHPNAPSLPSQEDDEFTGELQMLCALFGIRLQDHIVLGTGEPYSYFLSGRLESLRHEVDQRISGRVRREEL